MRRVIIAGNWKMNNTVQQALELVNGLRRELKSVRGADIIVCPPFTALSEAAKALAGSNIQLGAQDVYWEESGAYTGEIAAAMLQELGCRYVIVGHSERRIYFGETNEMVNKKAKAVLAKRLIPIICVGERLEQREKGATFQVIKDQIQGALKDITLEQLKSAVIAYEPVWAIGTGKTATPEQAQEAQRYIRGLIKQLYNQEAADGVRIQYGGSVKPDNITELLAQPDVDGALVGGASLKLESFVEIVKGSLKS